ncbi:hypothetical protein PoB_004448200, partial [Plakobranchus ocellatus]
MNQAQLTRGHVNSSLEAFLSYPLLGVSELQITTHCFYAGFGEKTSRNTQQCTKHHRADSYYTVSSYSFCCEHVEPTARNYPKRLAQLTHGYCAATAF